MSKAAKDSSRFPESAWKEGARIRFKLVYDGTDFCGWQKQRPHSHAPKAPSVQETVEKALAKVFGAEISVQASGRTDSGVHAFAQVCDFFLTPQQLKKFPKDLAWTLRAHLPPTLVPYAFQWAPYYFHSTRSAIAKTYRYRIWNGPRENPFVRRYRWWIRRPILPKDLDFLNSLSAQLIGEHDFKSFQSKGSPVRSTVRKIYRANWVVRSHRSSSTLQLARVFGENFLGETVEFIVTGNGFLKQMIRNLVGTQVNLWMNHEPAHRLGEILKARDRTQAGLAAPAKGLFLSRVHYPKALDSLCVNL